MTRSKATLPAVEVDGKQWWPVLISEDVSWNEGPGDPMFGVIQASSGMGHDEWRSIDESTLSALLAALSPEQRERALGPYLVEVITGRNQMRDNWNAACDALERQAAELESERAKRAELERRVARVERVGRAAIVAWRDALFWEGHNRPGMVHAARQAEALFEQNVKPTPAGSEPTPEGTP